MGFNGSALKRIFSAFGIPEFPGDEKWVLPAPRNYVDLTLAVFFECLGQGGVVMGNSTLEFGPRSKTNNFFHLPAILFN